MTSRQIDAKIKAGATMAEDMGLGFSQETLLSCKRDIIEGKFWIAS